MVRLKISSDAISGLEAGGDVLGRLHVLGYASGGVPSPAGTGVNVRYVTVSGSGSANGESWATATTLQNAHDTLPAAGGIIYVEGGSIPCNNVTWNKPITCEGAGSGSTEFIVNVSSARGLRILGDGSDGASRTTLRRLAFRGSESSSTNSWLVDIDSASFVMLDDVQFWSVGWNRTDTPSTGSGPYAIMFSNTQGGGSKHCTLRQSVVRRVFRTFFCGNGSSGRIDHSTIIGSRREYMHVSSAHWHLTGTHFPATNALDDATILRYSSGAKFSTIDMFNTETGAGPGVSNTDHMLIDGTAQKLIFHNNRFQGDNQGANNKFILTGSASDIIMGPYTIAGSVVFEDTSSGTNKRRWVPSDYTGSFS